ncbi:MAG: hypothetical protein N3G77_05635 [Nitrososphaeria archaeon]|nr:hypothetical protein [Nitrososphaeria archaeon]
MRIPVYLVYAIILISILASFLSGYYIGDYQFREQLYIKDSEIKELKMKNIELRSIVERSEERVLDLESERMRLIAQLENLERELSGLISKLQVKDKEIMRLNYSCRECGEDVLELNARLAEIRTVIDRLREDKELLVILKTSPPLNRTEAKTYWNDTRAGLYKINPNLALNVDAILRYLDYYFDWYEAYPEDATPERICAWIFSYPPEAENYESAISKLRDEIYIVLVSDLVEALRVLEEKT